jgi:hypothetical protein
MKREKEMTLYEELWECRFRTSRQAYEKSSPAQVYPFGLAEGIDQLFGKVE